MVKKEKFMTLKLSKTDKLQLKKILANAGIRAKGRKRKYEKKYPDSNLLSSLANKTITNTDKFLKMLGKGKFR